jgi:HEAT repeat protein
MKAVGWLGYVRTPSVVDVLLAVLRATDIGSTDPTYWTGIVIKSAALGALARHRDDPRAEAELQAASSDADPAVRQAAATALQVQ